MSDRDKIFSAIRAALQPLPERRAYPEWDDSLCVSNFARPDVATVALFRERLETAHAHFLEGWEALAAFLRQQAVAAGYVDAGLLPLAQAHLKGLTLETAVDRARIDELAFGITLASGGIAETGTLILRDADSPYRLGALAPWVHVAVLHRADLLRTVPEAVARFGEDPSIIWATGPSKTADVEGILIEGVHGPGCQACCLVD